MCARWRVAADWRSGGLGPGARRRRGGGVRRTCVRMRVGRYVGGRAPLGVARRLIYVRRVGERGVVGLGNGAKFRSRRSLGAGCFSGLRRNAFIFLYKTVIFFMTTVV